jgi:hypothetical protein
MRTLHGRSRPILILKASAVVGGATTAFFVAAAATNWTVGLHSGSDGEAQSAPISNLTIAAVASPGATNLLFPGGTGDVVVRISNPNAFPVAITDLTLPDESAQAAAYATSALSGSPVGGCDSSSSKVTWVGAVHGATSSHALTTRLVVAGAVGATPGTLTVTLTNEAQMDAQSPAACAGVYLDMPSLAGVTATGGADTPSAGPATDQYS